MLTLKVTRGNPPQAFASMQELTELHTTVAIYELKPDSERIKDSENESSNHPARATSALLYNGNGLQYLYPEDSAYVINETGGTVQVIQHADFTR